jgi:hypothetical protein
MGGKLGMYLLFIYHLHFYIYKLNFFLIKFLATQFLSDLTNQKDHFMVSKKTTSQVGRIQINLSSLTK